MRLAADVFGDERSLVRLSWGKRSVASNTSDKGVVVGVGGHVVVLNRRHRTGRPVQVHDPILGRCIRTA